jgi:hypothetical protein
VRPETIAGLRSSPRATSPKEDTRDPCAARIVLPYKFIGLYTEEPLEAAEEIESLLYLHERNIPMMPRSEDGVPLDAFPAGSTARGSPFKLEGNAI